MPRLVSRLKAILTDSSVRLALSVFIFMRILLSVWAIVSLAVNPLPEEPDEVLRPYLGETRLDQGLSGLLLGPWQRFDTLRYLNISREGYAQEENSVFPPLYPLAIRVLGRALGGGPMANLLVATVLSNMACLGMLILFHRIVSSELNEGTATRAVAYLVVFPTGFFLFAPYTEPIFMLFALSSLWAARGGRFWSAGAYGFLATLTRHTGWILIVPLAYEFWRQRIKKTVRNGEASHPANSGTRLEFLAVMMPAVALIGFITWRWWNGLPPLSTIYEQYWYQSTGMPGVDLISAFRSLFLGADARSNERIALSLDVAAALLLIATTILSFPRLGVTYGAYSASMLLFMLFPTSEVKPLYSFSRYTLAFFPTFILLAQAGKRPWINRLILYASFPLFLYFSGQFFAWGWVA